MLSSTVALFSLALPALVSAHGFVSQVTIDGKAYKGLSPYVGGGKSVIRQISGVEPVKGTWNPDLACGLKSKPASESAKASPGSTVSFKWSGGGNSNWPHEYGPLITYMADCNGPCEQFNAANAKWFKIHQVGKTNGNNWAQKDLMSGAPATVKIPSDLASGNYLIRHEIIALHIAENSGGAEFYPSCTQLKVEGNGWAKPDKTISLPGAYKENDKGLLIHVWTAKGDYIYPGGALAKFGGGSDSGSGSDAAPSKSKDAAPSSSKSPEPKPSSSKGSDGDSRPTSSKGSDGDWSPTSSSVPTSSKGSEGEWSSTPTETPTFSKDSSSSSPAPTSSKGSSEGSNNAVPSSSKGEPEWTKDWSPTSSSSAPTPSPSKNPDKGSNGSGGLVGAQGPSIPQGDSEKPPKDESEKPPKADKPKGDSDKPKGESDKPKDDDKPVKMPVRQRPCRPAGSTRRSLRTSRHRLDKMH